MFSDFFLSPILSSLPKIFFWIVFLITIFFYSKRQSLKKTYWFLAKISIGFRLFYAVFLSFGQYFVWSADSLGKNFLDLPLTGMLELRNYLPWLFGGRLGYFLFYSWGRFWLNFAITLLVAVVFWYFLRLLRRSNERFFEEGEIELGFLSVFIVGWPQALVFIMVAFFSVILLAFYRRVLREEVYTTLGYPFLFAVLATFIFSEWILEHTGLWILKI